MREGKTTPPQLLSESDLISSMDKNGIGTDATIHEHIAKIQERGYVVKLKDARLLPTLLGLGLVEGFDAIGLEQSLTRPLLRSQLESALGAVVRGERVKDAVLQEQLNSFRQAYHQVNRGINLIVDAIKRHLQANQSLDPFKPAPYSQQGQGRGNDNIDDDDDEENQDNRRASAPRKPRVKRIAPNCCGRPAVRKGRGRAAHWHCDVCSRSVPEVTEFSGSAQNAISASRTTSVRQVPAQSRTAQVNSSASAASAARELSLTQAINVSAPDAAPLCQCGQPARQLVASTANNAGRRFWGCSGCNFFLWIDAPRNNPEPSNATNSEPPKCHCGYRATRFQPEQGNAFWRCSKQVMRCNFAQALNGQPIDAACFKCGQPGHFANRCPTLKNNARKRTATRMVDDY